MTEPLERPVRILVVDDCPDTALSTAKLLRLWGYEPLVAGNGPEALQLAADTQAEVVLLDIAMPGMTGWEVARRLRALPGLQGTLLIAVSGYGREEDQRSSREAGCDLHLIKPVDLDNLKQLLSQRRRVS